MFGIKALKERVKKLEEKSSFASNLEKLQERNKENLVFLGTSNFEYRDSANTYSDPYVLEFLQDKETGNITINIVTADPIGKAAQHPWYLTVYMKIKYENTLIPIYDIQCPSQYLVDILQSKGYVWNPKYNYKTKDKEINWLKKDVEPEKSPE